jgi:hypothetical protein
MIQSRAGLAKDEPRRDSVRHRVVCLGSFASILACPQHVRLWGNHGSADCPVLTVEGIGMNMIQAAKRAPRIMRYELTEFEWALSGR